MTPEFLASTAAILLSLVFSYVPLAGDWYNALDTTKQRLVRVGLMLAVAVGAVALACSGYDLFGLALTCDQAGFVATLKAFIAALVANQATYLLSPRIGAVQDRKPRG